MTNADDFVRRPVPSQLGERLRTLFRLELAPATLGEVAALISTVGSTAPSAEALCTSGESRHEVDVGGQTHRTHCVMDALILPALEGDVGTIRSESPLDRRVVEIRVTPDGAEADPPEAVVSFGVRREGSGTAQEIACPYINAFASMDEYVRWAAETPEAATMVLPLSEAVALARSFARRGGS